MDDAEIRRLLALNQQGRDQQMATLRNYYGPVLADLALGRPPVTGTDWYVVKACLMIVQLDLGSAELERRLE